MSGEAIATTDGTNDKENKKMATSAQRPDRPRAEAVQDEGFHAESDGLLSRVTNIASSVVSVASGMTGPWRRQITEYDRTKALIETRKKQLSRLIQEENDLGHAQVRVEEHARKLATWRGRLGRDLQAVAQDLQAIHMIAPSEQTLRPDDFKSSFSQLNRAIYDMAAEMIHVLPQDALQCRLQDVQLQGRSVDSEPIRNFLNFSFHHHSGLRTGYVAQYVLTHLLCSDICRTIYSSFAPGISSTDNEVLMETYSAMEKAETQERVSRWRAMTYSHLGIDGGICRKSASDALGVISSFLAIFPGFESSSSILKPFTEKVTAVYRRAFDFQDRAQTLCTDVNINVSISAEDVKWIKIHQGIGVATEIIMPLGMGLFTSEVICHKDGSTGIRKDCLYSLLVIANNWAPVKPKE